jgi:hypothetical protein
MKWIAGLAVICSLAQGGAPPSWNVAYRSGPIVVRKNVSPLGLPYHNLIIGGIDRGTNFLKPADKADYGDPDKDLSRLPTTYYHVRSPIAMVLQQWTSFSGPKSLSATDARVATSLVGLGAAPLSFDVLPNGEMAALGTQPAIGVVGMYAGTLAAYAQPFQTMDFYESNPKIIHLSLPKKGPALFSYIEDARARGANIRVFEGPARRTVALKAPKKFYQVLVVEICPHTRLEDLAVDLFTKEGMSALLDKLADDGILCYHTSNKYIGITPVLADVAESLGCVTVVGHDMAYDQNTSAYSSEWTIVARKQDILSALKVPEKYKEKAAFFFDEYWKTLKPTGKHLWTDNSKHSLKGLRHMDPFMDRLGGAINLSLHISNGFVPWYALTGVPDPPQVPYSLTFSFSGLATFVRDLTDPTLGDLQKGYPKEE